MALPQVTMFVGLDKDLRLNGPGTATLNFSSYDDIKFICPSLSITKLLSTGATALETANSGADIIVHILAADTSGKSVGPYEYQLEVKTGTKWFDVAGKGLIQLVAVAA